MCRARVSGAVAMMIRSAMAGGLQVRRVKQGEPVTNRAPLLEEGGTQRRFQATRSQAVLANRARSCSTISAWR